MVRSNHSARNWLLMLAFLLPTAGHAAEMRPELKDEIAAGETELKQGVAQKIAATDLLAVRGRLARKYREAHWGKKAEEQYKEMLKLFGKAALAKNGGPEASWAAEAQFWLLDVRYDAALQTKIAFGKTGKVAEQLAGQIRAMRTQIAGEEVVDPAGGIPSRKGGLCGDYATLVSAYRSIEWGVAVAVAQSRLLSHVAEVIRDTPLPTDQGAEDQAQWRQIIDEQARDFEAQALRLVQAAWDEQAKRNLDTPWRVETVRELNRFLPKMHPLSRVRAEKWLIALPEDQQQTLKTGGVLDDIHGCYDRHVAAAPDEMLGEVQVKFTLQPDGVAKIASIEHADPVVSQCLKRLWGQRKDLPRFAAPLEIHVRMELASL